MLNQALVGDKTLAFRLMDADMYWHMNRESQNLVIDRGIALHKLIRTMSLFIGGEGYLTFMGNEFGHPEWIDFPREGNDWSYQHCRRQWSLAQDENLRYIDLLRFDQALIKMARETKVLSADPAQILHVHNDDKVLIIERNNSLLILNLHPNRFYDFHPVTPPTTGIYRPVLNSDEKQFGGYDQTTPSISYPQLDTDNIITAHQGCSINEIFSNKGEEHFRGLELDVITQMIEQNLDHHIISTGGGIVTSSASRTELRKLGFVVWLTANTQTILDRTSDSKHRPLLNCDNPEHAVSDLI